MVLSLGQVMNLNFRGVPITEVELNQFFSYSQAEREGGLNNQFFFHFFHFFLYFFLYVFFFQAVDQIHDFLGRHI